MSSHISHVTEICIQILQSEYATHDLCIAAAKLVIAEVESNSRFLAAKATAAEEALLATLEAEERELELLAEAWRNFVADPVRAGDALLAELRKTAELLSRLP